MFLIQVRVSRGRVGREERFFVFGNPAGKISRNGFVLRLDQINANSDPQALAARRQLHL